MTAPRLNNFPFFRFNLSKSWDFFWMEYISSTYCSFWTTVIRELFSKKNINESYLNHNLYNTIKTKFTWYLFNIDLFIFLNSPVHIACFQYKAGLQEKNSLLKIPKEIKRSILLQFFLLSSVVVHCLQFMYGTVTGERATITKPINLPFRVLRVILVDVWHKPFAKHHHGVETR